jgi:formylglycine-generating enzyme required for sulfatase activity
VKNPVSDKRKIEEAQVEIDAAYELEPNLDWIKYYDKRHLIIQEMVFPYFEARDKAIERAKVRVDRGGCWYNYRGVVRVTTRSGAESTLADLPFTDDERQQGFRLVKTKKS